MPTTNPGGPVEQFCVLLSSRLSDIIANNNLANSYMSFSTSYSDTGLWGIYLVMENLANLDDVMHFTLHEWTRMSIAPTTGEVERAKSQLKASLLLGRRGACPNVSRMTSPHVMPTTDHDRD